jgi:hypothetical protein
MEQENYTDFTLNHVVLDINDDLQYVLYFANFGGTHGDDEVAILEIVDKITDEVIVATMKQALEEVSADRQQREAQLLKEFPLMVELLTTHDWQEVAKYDDKEWVLSHRVMYALTRTAPYVDNIPF